MALLVNFILIGFVEVGVLKITGGMFMYPLDDPFIHMQVAKNLAFHGVWGINATEFASASSSLLYTVLLALLSRVFGAGIGIPFVVNLIASGVLLFVVHQWLVHRSVGVRWRACVLLGLVLFLPLPVLVISGMEHVLQCIFCFLFVTRLAVFVGGRSVGLVLLAMLVTGIRYEGMFLVGMGCLVLFFRRQYVAGLVLGALALLPIVLFGVWSVKQGSYFLPNSVLVKSENIPFSVKGMIEYVNNILINKYTVVKPQVKAAIGSPPPGISLLTAQRLLLVFPLAYLVYARYLRAFRVYGDILVMAMGVTLLHLALAATGWLYRYEAYLVLMALVVVPVVIWEARSSLFVRKDWIVRAFVVVLVFGLFFPFVLRSAAAWSNIKQACVNIYQQQYQMSRFLKKYHAGDAVAANDIGAISFYGDIKTVDLWGLGDIEVARSRKGGYWTPGFLDSLERRRNVKVMMVYDEWFSPELLSHWTKVATWTIQHNVILGGDTVSFYVPVAADAPGLEGQLKEFAASLPAGITVEYMR